MSHGSLHFVAVDCCTALKRIVIAFSSVSQSPSPVLGYVLVAWEVVQVTVGSLRARNQ